MSVASSLRGRGELVAAGGLVVATAIFYALCSLDGPYHLDTAVFGKIITAISEGTPYSSFRSVNAYLYYLPVRVLGDAGFKWTNVAVIASFALLYYSVVRHDHTAPVAWCSTLLVVTMPATIVTVAHLKEDLNALVPVAAAILACRRSTRPWHLALAGAFWGFAIVLKEFPIALFPFFALSIGGAAYVAERGRGLRQVTLRISRDAIVFVASAAATVFVLDRQLVHTVHAMTQTPYTGQFLGPFSEMQAEGFRLWLESAKGFAWVQLFSVAGLVFATLRRRWRDVLWAATAIGTFFLLSNITVMRARLFVPFFFFSVPVTVYGASELFAWGAEAIGRRVGTASKNVFSGVGWRAAPLWALVGGASLIGAWHVWALLPTLEYRRAYAPQRAFYGGLAEAVPAGSLLYGSDNCDLATYYSHLTCIAHDKDPTKGDYAKLADGIRQQLASTPVFLLPDFLSYDGLGTLRRQFAADFSTIPAYTAWAEDYHPLTYAPSLDEALAESLAALPGCNLTGTDAPVPVAINDRLAVDKVVFHIACPDGASTLDALEYRGRFVFLKRESVLAVHSRQQLIAGPGRP
jgi:hypothetical protein